MQHTRLFLVSVIFLLSFISACNSQDKPTDLTKNSPTFTLPSVQSLLSESAAQIDEYVVEVFEDKKGNLWFGTLSKGVAFYDGKTLSYLSAKDGLIGNAVVSITEDQAGNMWFGTHNGLSKYDGSKFTNFGSKEGLCNSRISKVFIDIQEKIWIGTWGGVCQFDGKNFTNFPLPQPTVDTPLYVETMNWVTDIIEDQQGNIWFSRSGYGVSKYDGNEFTNFTKEDGLPSNCVQAMKEDQHGSIWFGTRMAERDHPEKEKRTGNSGLSRYDGEQFHHYPSVEGLNQNDIFALAEDRAGNIWIGVSRLGLYHYDGEQFSLFKDTDRPDLNKELRGIQSILEDKNGAIWLGLSGGLFRLKANSIIHVSQDGPWE